MCGLVGIITNFSSGLFSQELNIFKELLFFDVIRGSDATGVTVVYNDKEVVTKKAAVDSGEFLSESEVKWLLNNEAKTGGKALLGHNRKSTIGKDTDENAHPFMLKNRYAFFHNGTLKEHKKLHDTEVDSEALGLHLTETEGNKEKLEEALAVVKGAYACIWYDQEQHKIFFIRNHERPLYLAKFENNAGYAYASEDWMLKGILERNNQKISSIFPLKIETLYTLDLDVHPLSVIETPLTVKKHTPQSQVQTQTQSQAQTQVKPLGMSVVGGTPTASVTKLLAKTPLSAKLANHFKITLKNRLSPLDLFIEDLLPLSGELKDQPKWAERDWVVWCISDDYPGVIFRGTIRNQSYHDMMYLSDSTVYGTFAWAQYYPDDNYMEAWVRDLTFVTTKGPNDASSTVNTATGQ